MKNMKKILLLLLTVALMLSVCLALSACGGGSDPCQHEDKDGDGICDKCDEPYKPEADVKPVELITNGEANFQFVLASDVDSAMIKAVDDTIKALKKIDITVVRVADKESTIEDCEVLIGNVKSRGEEYIVPTTSLGKKGSAIKIINSKIVINAGTPAGVVEAYEKFVEEILGLTDDTEELLDVVMSASQQIEKIQSDYRITALKVNGNDMREYTIAADTSKSDHKKAATTLQDMIYTRTGYWFEIVKLDSATYKSIVFKSIDKVYNDNSFKIFTNDNGQLIIECAFDNKLETSVSSFITAKITAAEGEVNFQGDLYKKDISVVTYEEFGAKGDGETDDFIAIRDAHNFANKGGQTVKAKAGAHYYIKDTLLGANVEYVSIKTPTDWTGAEFTIDDRDIDGRARNDVARTNIFVIESDYDTITISDEETLSQYYGVGPGTTKLDLGLGYPAMIVITNKEHKVYRRYGLGYAVGTRKGHNQDEVILLDKNGNIDPSTPFMFDYEKVTKIVIYPLEENQERLIVEGGVFTTRACQTDSSFMVTKVIDGVETEVESRMGYFSRGIEINRSFTTVKNVKHYVTDEITVEQHRNADLQGAHYRSFYYGAYSNDIMFENCILQGRRYYGVSGTYDFSGEHANKIVLKNCVQHNFWIDADGNPTTQENGGESSMRYNDINGKDVRNCWGIGGTNFCKNMEYYGCTMSRFDAHEGLYNGKIIDSTVNFFAITGMGDLTIENTTWYSIGNDSPQVNNSLIYLRDDYGSIWNGTITIRNVEAYTSEFSTFHIVFHTYKNWYFGYKCAVPNIILDNFHVANEADNVEVRVYTFNSFRNEPAMHKPITEKQKRITDVETLVPDDSYENINVTAPPTKVQVLNNTHNYTYVLPETGEGGFFSETKFYYGTGENDYYLGTTGHGDDIQVFKFTQP
jgi:hypothetical protein